MIFDYLGEDRKKCSFGLSSGCIRRNDEMLIASKYRVDGIDLDGTQVSPFHAV
jgi:hypothetical protein